VQVTDNRDQYLHNYLGTGKKEKYIKTVMLPLLPTDNWEEDSFLED